MAVSVLRLRLLACACLCALLALSAAAAPPALAQSPDWPQEASGGQEPWDESGGEDFWEDDATYADEDPASGGQVPWDQGAGGSTAGTLPPATTVAPVAPAVPVTPAAPVTPVQPEVAQIPVVTGATVAGKVAMLRADGKAAVPRGAPKRVRTLIAALNEIVGKPYKWGGGHAKLVDRGYDCSGAVGYGLIRTGMLTAPMVSGQMAKWGAAGSGRWLSIYANKGHVYLEVAGLRLDTSPIGDATRRSGVRWRPVIGRRAGFHARHVVGL